MSMQTLIIRGPEEAPDRIWCQTCSHAMAVFETADQAREHVTAAPGHVVAFTVSRRDLMVAGGDLWVVSPYTTTEAAEEPGQS